MPSPPESGGPGGAKPLLARGLPGLRKPRLKKSPILRPKTTAPLGAFPVEEVSGTTINLNGRECIQPLLEALEMGGTDVTPGS